MNGQHLSPGLTIWAGNDEALGIIVQVLGDYLRLRTDEGKEYWLPANAVRLDQDRAVVEFRSGELLSFTVPAPDAYDESQYIETEHRTDEEEKQRAQVLRELSEQRQRLRAHDALPDADRTVGEPVEQELQEIVGPEGSNTPHADEGDNQWAQDESEPSSLTGNQRGSGAAWTSTADASGLTNQAPGLLDNTALRVQRGVRAAFGAVPASSAVERVLRGGWLGHPLHPVLTDAVTAGMTMAVVLDGLDAMGISRLDKAADVCVGFAIAWTIPTALSGAADWQHAEGRARRLGVVHIAANVSASTCNAMSLAARLRGRRAAARWWGLAAFGLVNVGAYLGGELVYDEGMAVATTH